MSEACSVPFDRGQTLFGSAPTGTTIATTDQVQFEGQKKRVWDATYNGWVELLCVRNVSGIALQPKRLVTFKAGQFGRQVDGYADVAAEGPAYPVDDQLAGTVADKDLFWIVIGGPCLIKTDMASLTSFLAGAVVHAQTAANSTAAGTTGVGGRIDAVPLTGNTATQAIDRAANQVGYALTARTTNNTGTDTLVFVAPMRF